MWLLLVVVAVVTIVRLIRNRNGNDVTALLVVLVATVTAALGVAISLTKSPIYRDQYVFPALMLLAIFFGLAF